MGWETYGAYLTLRNAEPIAKTPEFKAWLLGKGFSDRLVGFVFDDVEEFLERWAWGEATRNRLLPRERLA
jgi:hypothetical protein